MDTRFMCWEISKIKGPYIFQPDHRTITIVGYKSRRYKQLSPYECWLSEELKGLNSSTLSQPHGVTEPKGISLCDLQSLAVEGQDTSFFSGLEEPVVVLKLPFLVLFQAECAFEGENPLSVVPMPVTGLSW